MADVISVYDGNSFRYKDCFKNWSCRDTKLRVVRLHMSQNHANRHLLHYLTRAS